MEEHEIMIPPAAKMIMKLLNDEGHYAYVVGGCVRDSLLGRRPHDWDICTSATPDEMWHICVVNGLKYIETGLKHGTMTIGMLGEYYEVTTFRVDGEYSDGRHPDNVRFVTSLVEDLSRRDFTINAMAYNDREGLIDPFGGQFDLKHKLLRCVGSPDKRFQEDALRILRALRFASTYGLEIHGDTSYAIHLLGKTLSRVSAERIQTELIKLLKGEKVLDILLKYRDIIEVIIPEIGPCIGFNQNNRYHQYTVYGHIAHAVANYKDDDTSVKVALLLHDIGKPECYTEDEKGGHFHGHSVPSARIAEQVLNRLRFDNKTKQEVIELVQYHDATIEPTPKVVKKWLNKIGEERFAQLLEVRMADIKAHKEDTQQSRIDRCVALERIMGEVILENQCFQMKDLAVNGRDILALGIPEGKMIGEILNHLLDVVIQGDVPNKYEYLIAAAKAYIEK